MKLRLCAVGRLRAGPEKALVDDYLKRFDRIGRALGLGPAEVVEVDAKGAGMAAEGALLAKAVPEGAALCVLDERGQQMSSPDFAALLARWRDDGAGAAVFVIGGADGLDPALRERSTAQLSFGRMVWPHMLVRVMLAEQVYRAASILSGNPYHRE